MKILSVQSHFQRGLVYKEVNSFCDMAQNLQVCPKNLIVMVTLEHFSQTFPMGVYFLEAGGVLLILDYLSNWDSPVKKKIFAPFLSNLCPLTVAYTPQP